MILFHFGISAFLTTVFPLPAWKDGGDVGSGEWGDKGEDEEFNLEKFKKNYVQLQSE